jgi:truncated hemoglobin YjbI
MEPLMPKSPEEIAVMVAEKANQTLQPLETAMNRNDWPPDLRKIMWQAVADTAAALAAEQQ